MDIANGDADNGLIAAVPAVAQLEDPAFASGTEQRTQYEPESAVVTSMTGMRAERTPRYPSVRHHQRSLGHRLHPYE
jgi:hypothetical protein